jgi:hypothetical protein
MIDISDGAITRAPHGGERAARSPLDRGKGAMKRSTGANGYGIPLEIVGATANRRDGPLLRDAFDACSTQLRHCWPQQDAAHLEREYDSKRSRSPPRRAGPQGHTPEPDRQAMRRGSTASAEIRLRTDLEAEGIDFCHCPTVAMVTIRQLIQRARTLYR